VGRCDGLYEALFIGGLTPPMRSEMVRETASPWAVTTDQRMAPLKIDAREGFKDGLDVDGVFDGCSAGT
jgi:hypothetical protein